MFESQTPTAREVDRLASKVETLCYDWRRMRFVIERLARMPWWDLHSLCCHYCQAPFDIGTGQCRHEPDCVYERCCQIAGLEPLLLPEKTVLTKRRAQQ